VGHSAGDAGGGKVYPEYAARLKERNLVAQFRLRDRPVGRWIQLENGKHPHQVRVCTRSRTSTSTSRTQAIAESFLTPPFDLLERIDAAKNFKIGLEGPDDLAVWFMPP
jgi:hypothetical protein